MESYKECVPLNAEAISLIQAGRCDEGIALLTKALTLLQPLLDPTSVPAIAESSSNTQAETRDEDMEVEKDTEEDTDAPQDLHDGHQDKEEVRQGPEQDEGMFQLPDYFSVCVVSPDDCASKPLFSTEGQIFTFYNRMYEITKTDFVHHLGVPKTFVLLLFNFAMAHHIHAANDVTRHFFTHNASNNQAAPSSSVSRKFRLSTILEMYQSVSIAARSTLSIEEVKDVLCVIMAAANNTGHLHSYLQEFDKVKSSLTLQLQLMGLLSLEGPIGCAIPKIDHAILLSSVYVFLEGPGLSNSPAA